MLTMCIDFIVFIANDVLYVNSNGTFTPPCGPYVYVTATRGDVRHVASFSLQYNAVFTPERNGAARCPGVNAT